MKLADLIRRMAEAGAPPEAIAIAVEAIESAQAERDAELEARRAKAAEKKRRQRGTVPGTSRGRRRDKGGTDGGQGGDRPGDPPPVPPQENNSTPPPTSPGSEATASAADPAAAGETAEVDPKKVLFDLARPFSRLAGKSEDAIRRWMGQALGVHSVEAVTAGVKAAIDETALEPIAYAKATMDRLSRNELAGRAPTARGDPQERRMSVQEAARKLEESLRPENEPSIEPPSATRPPLPAPYRRGSH